MPSICEFGNCDKLHTYMYQKLWSKRYLCPKRGILQYLYKLYVKYGIYWRLKRVLTNHVLEFRMILAFIVCICLKGISCIKSFKWTINESLIISSLNRSNFLGPIKISSDSTESAMEFHMFHEWVDIMLKWKTPQIEWFTRCQDLVNVYSMTLTKFSLQTSRGRIPEMKRRKMIMQLEACQL